MCHKKIYLRKRHKSFFKPVQIYQVSIILSFYKKSSWKMCHKEIYLINDQPRSHPYISGLQNSFILQKKLFWKICHKKIYLRKRHKSCSHPVGLPLSCHCLARNTFPQQPQSNILTSSAFIIVYLQHSYTSIFSVYHRQISRSICFNSFPYIVSQQWATKGRPGVIFVIYLPIFCTYNITYIMTLMHNLEMKTSPVVNLL